LKDNRGIEDFLIELKSHGEKNDIPNISLANARFLRDLIKIKQPKNILEVGTANGFSVINFALECKNYWWHVDTIEFSQNSYDRAEGNINLANLEDYITQYFWNALDLIPKMKNTYDFIFIDGMKRRTKDFFELSYPLLNDGWIMIIDDVILYEEKMKNLYEYLDKENIIYNIIPIDVQDGVIMIIK
jgi:predicted O-methyltransferase YrrM